MRYITISHAIVREMDILISEHLHTGWKLSGNAYTSGPTNGIHNQGMLLGDYRNIPKAKTKKATD